MNGLADQIRNPDGSSDYTRIMLEFAKLPRSGWRSARERLDLVIQQAKRSQGFIRWAWPKTDGQTGAYEAFLMKECGFIDQKDRGVLSLML